MMFASRAAVAAVLGFSAVLPAQNSLVVTHEPANVVASRILGSWEPEVPLTTRLTGKAPTAPNTAGASEVQIAGRIAFRSDTSVLARIPRMMSDALLREVPDLKVYLAGYMTIAAREHVFFLTNLKGNMQVLIFLPRGNEPMGNGESFIVQLAIASEPANDILLVGGDFNNQPFSAMKRVSAGQGG
jgi:hypothetical protein